MALAYLTINLDAFTGDDRPPLSSYSTITLDPGVDHIDAAADVIHVRTIVVSLDRQGKAATANGVPCVDGKVPVVAGVAYAVSAPNVLRGGPHYIPALTAGQVVALSDYITPGTPLTPDQVATLTARIVALEAAPPGVTDHGALTGLGDDDHTQYLNETRGDARYVQGTDSRLSDARTPTAHTHPVAQVSDSTATGRALVTATDAAAARGTLGLDTAATVGALPIPDPGSFYPTDTITAALQLIGGRELYGTGSPEGVVAAPAGTYYTNTAGTNGAWRWLKKTGTGTTGWNVTVGDTGLRDITLLMTNGGLPCATGTGTLHARRVGDVVTFVTNGRMQFSATPSIAPMAGFTPMKTTLTVWPWTSWDTTTVRALVYNFGWINGSGPLWNNASLSMTHHTFLTNDAWPTTLPGTAG